MSTRNDRTDQTAPLSRTARELVGGLHPARAELALVVFHRDGVEIVPLEPGKPMIVGRSSPADVVVADASLSRRHARFLLERGSLSVEDLGSTNGTRVRGETVRRAALKPGEPVTLGAVVAAAHLLPALSADRGGFCGHDRFVFALERELVLAAQFAEPLSVAMVRADAGAADGHVGRWCPDVRRGLRAIDLVGVYSDDTIEVLLPRTGAAEAADVVGKACGEKRFAPLALRVGIAGASDPGSTADRILELCRDATLAATDATPVHRAAQEGSFVVQEARARTRTDEPVIASAAMREAFAMAERIARSDLPVLVLGETGTGKELIARAIHERGPRRSGPLVTVNCGAIPAQLVESTLFGHERGAFTGAERTTDGVFGAANGGTVLLDEIGELPLSAQTALLRVLETKRVTRVGSTKEIEVDVRVVAATHRDLEALSGTGAFRSDLFFRLNVATIALPPLRDRPDEIPLLAERFARAAAALAKRSLEGIREETLEQLVRYRWPGNVRELKNAIERAVVIARGQWIEPDDLPARLVHVEPPASKAPVDLPRGGDLKSQVRAFEVGLVAAALRAARGNRAAAAAALGVPLRTLAHRIQVLGITKRDYE